MSKKPPIKDSITKPQFDPELESKEEVVIMNLEEEYITPNIYDKDQCNLPNKQAGYEELRDKYLSFTDVNPWLNPERYNAYYNYSCDQFLDHVFEDGKDNRRRILDVAITELEREGRIFEDSLYLALIDRFDGQDRSEELLVESKEDRQHLEEEAVRLPRTRNVTSPKEAASWNVLNKHDLLIR